MDKKELNFLNYDVYRFLKKTNQCGLSLSDVVEITVEELNQLLIKCNEQSFSAFLLGPYFCKQGNIWVTACSGKRLDKLYTFLYNRSSVYLERKKRKFEIFKRRKTK